LGGIARGSVAIEECTKNENYAAGLHPTCNPSNEATSIILQKNFETNKKNAIY
jgi:hypothetical protein